VGELLSTVPYFILVRNEFKTNEKRSLKIIDKALRMAKALYEQLAEVARSSRREKLVRLERHLGLAALYASLQKHRSRSTRIAVRTFDSVRVRYLVIPMSKLLAVSEFLSGRSRERRRVDSTCNYILTKFLGSANDVVPQGAPKSSLSKLSNVSSTLVPSPLFTLKARRNRTDSILELSSDANFMSTSSYIRTPLDENLPSNTYASSGSAETNDADERLCQSKMQNAELDGTKKRAQDLEIEPDQALIHARDTRDMQGNLTDADLGAGGSSQVHRS
ncbi:hypothetical protein BDN70DRAFT_889139, partial [Pholiota conissans]